MKARQGLLRCPDPNCETLRAYLHNDYDDDDDDGHVDNDDDGDDGADVFISGLYL